MSRTLKNTVIIIFVAVIVTDMILFFLLFVSLAHRMASDQSNIAQKTWELSNNVETISTIDEIYRYDRKEQQDILTAKPWEKE